MLIDDHTVVLSAEDLRGLPEYSSTLPTGTTIGKRWKRKRDYYDESKGWIMGEYVEHPDPGKVGIVWRDIELV